MIKHVLPLAAPFGLLSCKLLLMKLIAQVLEPLEPLLPLPELIHVGHPVAQNL